MTNTITLDEVHDLLTLVLANLRMGGAVEASATPIDQVAEACGFAPSSLLKDCQADRVEHVQYGHGRAMTPGQVAKFLAQHTRGGELTAERTGKPAEAGDELAEARETSRKAANRQRPRRAA